MHSGSDPRTGCLEWLGQQVQWDSLSRERRPPSKIEIKTDSIPSKRTLLLGMYIFEKWLVHNCYALGRI